jgi:hypothetical protein
MPGYKAVKAQLFGLMRMYLIYHGPHSLAPRRAEPMRFSMVDKMVSIPINGTVRVGARMWTDSDHDIFMFRRLICFMMVTAFRLAEIVWHLSGEIMFLTRACAWWVIGGIVFLDPTREQLLSLKVGDKACVCPPRAKPDQWGEIHCPFPVTLPFRPEVGNAAAGLRDIELNRPCHGAERETFPLFATASGVPYTHSVLGSLLRSVLTHLFGSAVASLYTWHSFRAGLATALHASGCPDAVIQLICRWMCPESLHVYRRIGGSEHVFHVQRAASANVDLIQSKNVVRVSGDQNFASLSQHWAHPVKEKEMEKDFQIATNPPAAPQTLAPKDDHPKDDRPITKLNAVGRRVLVPAEIWPGYKCREHGGEGWEASIISATALSAVVHFTHHHAAGGRAYQNERLPLELLRPI